jgi:hypothetical protein
MAVRWQERRLGRGWPVGSEGAACWEEVEVVAGSQREEVVAGRKTTEAGRGSVARGRRGQRGRAVALTLG